MRIYGNMARKGTVFDVCCRYRWQKLQTPLVSSFCLLSVFWASPSIRVCMSYVTALSAVVHCCLMEALLVWGKGWEGEHCKLMKSLNPGAVALTTASPVGQLFLLPPVPFPAYSILDLPLCSSDPCWVWFSPPRGETGRPEGLELENAHSLPGIRLWHSLLPPESRSLL